MTAAKETTALRTATSLITKASLKKNFATKLEIKVANLATCVRHNEHVTPLLKSLSWLPVKDQLYHRQAIMAFKCMTGHAPEHLTSQFITREQVRQQTTRSSQKLNIPLFRTASGQRTFYQRTVKLWNN